MTVGAGYLDTMRIPLLEGRDFNAADNADGPQVAIVNQTLADGYGPTNRRSAAGFSSAATSPDPASGGSGA